MANEKISQFPAQTSIASGFYLPIVDPYEAAAADQNKRVGFDIIDGRYYALARGNAATASGNAGSGAAVSATGDATTALASGNAGISVGLMALASGNEGVALATTAQASGNAALALAGGGVSIGLVVGLS